MPLTLLPPLNLSSAREFLKFEVTCTGRPIPRPSLPSYDSYASSKTASTDSTSSRRNKPSLSPEALLAHAFGPSAQSRLTAPSSSTSTRTIASESQSNSTCQSASSDPSVRSSSRCSSESSGQQKKKAGRDFYPAPPPLGTFRSSAKPSKCPSLIPGRLLLDEMGHIQTHTSDSSSTVSERDTPARRCQRTVEREPLMSPEEWREKVEERLERRKLLRLLRADKTGKMPLDIDCRPMEGSIGLPPAAEAPRTRKARLGKRVNSAPALIDFVDAGKEKGEESLLEMEDILLKEISTRRRSMVEMPDIENLIVKMNLEDLRD